VLILYENRKKENRPLARCLRQRAKGRPKSTNTFNNKKKNRPGRAQMLDRSVDCEKGKIASSIPFCMGKSIVQTGGFHAVPEQSR